MSRYIDAEKIEWHEQLEPLGNGKYEYCRVAYMDDIDDIPSADVRENVHGEWIDDYDPVNFGEFRYKCSKCGARTVEWADNFCYQCGADMRGEQDE